MHDTRLLRMVLLLGVLMVLGTPVQAQVPHTFSYQAALSDSLGSSLPDGLYELEFRIYPTEAGGGPLWSETQTVESVGGVVSSILGESSPLTIDLDQPLWFAFSIDGGPETTPRSTLTAVPTSLLAVTVADGAITTTKIADATAVRSLNGVRDAVSLVGGPGVTLEVVGQTITISSGGSAAGNTLDESYDEGGSGAGRAITADAGPVEVLATGAPAIVGEASGSGAGILGRSKLPASAVPLPNAGVVGESRDDTGVFGRSRDGAGVVGVSDEASGVLGLTSRAGTLDPAAVDDVVAGVRGETPAIPNPNLFAVVGEVSTHGTGVLGIGGVDGQGVFGIASATGNTAGVRGTTKEPGGWEVVDPGKAAIGVYGQAKSWTGVWGQSETGNGVVGTTGTKLVYGDLPSPRAAVLGHSDSPAPGVHGDADNDDATAAGVLAEGGGVLLPGVPRSAALEVRDGAIRVTGPNVPAAEILLPAPSIPIFSCTSDGHTHVIGWYVDVTLDNPLMTSSSVLLLTTRPEFPFPRTAYTAHIMSKSAGSALVRLSVIGDYTGGGCMVPPGGVYLNFLIIGT
ncbi:MAG: hypothetical protein IT349_09875 [Candidatus Eisenbacteria bacterium]|nr:hypothetical protein [Candidatus Eisenbacteria bacterium]